MTLPPSPTSSGIGNETGDSRVASASVRPEPSGVEGGRKRPSVMERFGHTIDDAGFIDYDDRPLSWKEADKRAGRRLDRRKNWAFINGRLCDSVTYTRNCSGCSYDTDYGSSRGGGCEECGYHGVIRCSEWIPVIVECCEWLRARSVLENSKAPLADATNNPPSDPGTEQREAGV